MRPGRWTVVVAAVVIGAGLAAVASFSTPPPAVPPPALWRLSTGGPGWQVTGVRSVTDVLMVTVVTNRLHDMPAIARDIVTPSTDEILEALVYFRRPGAATAAGRVAWTPRDGYVVTMFDE